MKSRLGIKFARLVVPARDAGLDVRLEANSAPRVTVRREQAGVIIDVNATAKQVESRLRGLDERPLPLRFIKDQPRLTDADVEPLKNAAAAAPR